MKLPIKAITSVLKVLIYLITSLTACGLAAILDIMSVSIIITAVILYGYKDDFILVTSDLHNILTYNMETMTIQTNLKI